MKFKDFIKESKKKQRTDSQQEVFDKYVKTINGFKNKRDLERIDSILTTLVRGDRITQSQKEQLSDIAYRRLMKMK